MTKEKLMQIVCWIAIAALAVGMGYFAHKQRQAQILEVVTKALESVKCPP